MATLGGIELDTVDYPTAFAFWLTSKCSFDVQRGADLSATVRLTKGADFAVVRFKQMAPAASLLDTAKKLANETLDFLCFSYCEPLLLKNPDEEYFSVSTESGKTKTLTYRTACPLPMRLGPLKITVRDKDGNEIDQPKVKPAWTPVLHYYRVSQSRDNIFDAYRYMFLAFEAVLQILCPIKASEGERRWMVRALDQIGQDIDLSKFVSNASTTAATAIVSEQYTRIRLPLFHSKKSSTSLPHEGLPEARILAAYKPLAKLVREIVSNSMGIRGGDSTFANSFIQSSFEAAMSNDVRMAVTPDALTLVENEFEKPESPIFYFKQLDLAPETQPYQRDAVGETKITKVLARQNIRSLGLFKQGEPYLISTLDTDLVPMSCNTLRGVFGLRHVNLGKPKWT